MSFLSNLLDGFRRGETRSASLQDLGHLSAAQLADIGVSPDQIGDVVESLLRSPRPDDTRFRHTGGWSLPGPVRGSWMGNGGYV